MVFGIKTFAGEDAFASIPVVMGSLAGDAANTKGVSNMSVDHMRKFLLGAYMKEGTQRHHIAKTALGSHYDEALSAVKKLNIPGDARQVLAQATFLAAHPRPMEVWARIKPEGGDMASAMAFRRLLAQIKNWTSDTVKTCGLGTFAANIRSNAPVLVAGV